MPPPVWSRAPSLHLSKTPAPPLLGLSNDHGKNLIADPVLPRPCGSRGRGLAEVMALVGLGAGLAQVPQDSVPWATATAPPWWVRFAVPHGEGLSFAAVEIVPGESSGAAFGFDPARLGMALEACLHVLIERVELALPGGKFPPTVQGLAGLPGPIRALLHEFATIN